MGKKKNNNNKKGISGSLQPNWDKVPNVVTYFLGAELKIGQNRAKMCRIWIKQEGMKGLGRWKKPPVGAEGRGGEGRAGFEGRAHPGDAVGLNPAEIPNSHLNPRVFPGNAAFPLPSFTCKGRALGKAEFPCGNVQ